MVQVSLVKQNPCSRTTVWAGWRDPYSRSDNDTPSLVVTVTNLGKQPVPISEIGLAEHWKSSGRVRKHTFPAGWRTLRYGEWPPPRDQGKDADVPKRGSGLRNVTPAHQTINPGDVIIAWDWVEEPVIETVRPFVRDVVGGVSWGPEITADQMRDAVASNEARAAEYG